jgi:hypothetical protein
MMATRFVGGASVLALATARGRIAAGWMRIVGLRVVWGVVVVRWVVTERGGADVPPWGPATMCLSWL